MWHPIFISVSVEFLPGRKGSAPGVVWRKNGWLAVVAVVILLLVSAI